MLLDEMRADAGRGILHSRAGAHDAQLCLFSPQFRETAHDRIHRGLRGHVVHDDAGHMEHDDQPRMHAREPCEVPVDGRPREDGEVEGVQKPCADLNVPQTLRAYGCEGIDDEIEVVREMEVAPVDVDVLQVQRNETCVLRQIWNIGVCC